MGCVNTITYDSFPKQRNVENGCPYCSVGARVKVYYYYDTSKFHLGTIVRNDIEEPFQTIIKLDNGRYLRSVECQFSYLSESEEQCNIE